MKFGLVATRDAVGAISAHGIRAGDLRVRKGQPISAELAMALNGAGVGSLIAARLEDGDVGEDEAARRLATRAAGPGIRIEPPFTGRANLFATAAGILLVDADRVAAGNGVDEAITFATLPAYKAVVAGEMVASAKIIPYGVAGERLDAALDALAGPVVSVATYRLRRVAAISTLTPALKPTVVGKTIAALAGRLQPAGAAVASATTCPHETNSLAARLAEAVSSGAELVVIFGASAIADRRDVIPAAIEAAGGVVEHLGMPVDPGNLLLVGRLGAVPVIGAPGCARSPKENGFDWVLGRLLAGRLVTRADIAAMGVGGLLMEIVSRGQPRAGGESAGDSEA